MGLRKFRASAALEAFVISMGRPHRVSASAPNTYCKLLRWGAAHTRCDELPVFTYSPDSIFSPEADAAFQSWHDTLHYTEQRTFSLDGEWHLATEHMGQALRAGIPAHEALALFHFVYSRNLYYWRRGRQEVSDRAEFVQACLDHGIESAVNEDYLMQYACYC